MDDKIHLWLVMALMSISAYPYTDCCSCMSNHAQKAFCNSGFVIRAKFLGATSTDMASQFMGTYSLIKYEIETLEVFKGGAEIQSLRFIYTSTEYYCDYNVFRQNYNKDYLITGDMRNGRVDVIFCNYIVLWKELTNAQRKGIECAYKCQCKICSTWDCNGDKRNYCRLSGGNQWDYSIDPEKNNIEFKDLKCALDAKGVCTWQPIDA